MSARQVRVETRSRHQSDLKRVMHSTARVRKWEKKWVQVGDTSMQIFKWMPIKSDEQQQPNLTRNIASQIDTQHQEHRRDVLVPTDNQLNTLTHSNIGIFAEEQTKTVGSKMLSKSEQIGADIDRSHDDERVTLSAMPNMNNNFTSMHQRQDSDDQTNKRKLNEIDLMSSDSCGSSSYSSNNDGVDSNSSLAHDEPERASKRQKVASTMNNGGGDRLHLSYDVQNLDSVATTRANLIESHVISIDNSPPKTQERKDESMVVDESSALTYHSNRHLHQTQSTSNELGLNREETLIDVARLVTEEIVTRVSDCYMDY